MRTITQAAEQLNVSRKKIYNEIQKLNIETRKEGKNSYIPDDDFERLKARIREQMEEHAQSTQERTRNVLERDRSMIEGKLSDREYVDLKERIDFLEGQINIKDQQLQAKDYQINGLIQSTFNLSKALKSGDEVAATEEKEERASFFGRIFRKKA